MRRKLHPLEVYQRGRPFQPVQGEVRKESPPRQEARRTREPGATPHTGTPLRTLRKRLARMPLLGASAAVALLVLASAGLYALGFWPFSRAATAADDPVALRREWPDRTARAAGAELERVFCIQVASGVAAGKDVGRWLEEQDLWNARVRAQFPERDYFAKALLIRGTETRDGAVGDQVVVVLGQWTSSEEADVEAVLRWAQALQPEAAIKGIRPQDLSSN